MQNSKGFTLAEMMVASFMLIVAILGTMSFFIFQSGRGSDATKLKDARQNVALALTLIRRDIELAALGTTVTDTPPVFVKANTSPGVTPDTFYVTYNSFMDWSYDIDNLTDTNSIWRVSPAQTVVSSGSSLVYKMIPLTININPDTRPVGSFVVAPGTGGTIAVDVDWNNASNTRTPPSDPTNNTQDWTAYLKAGPAFSGTAIPAIRYEIIQPGDPLATANQPTGELCRNGLRIAGGAYDVDVYNLTIRDRSYRDPLNPTAALPTALSFEIIIQ